VYDGGIYREIRRGISLGCSLSPLMGALYLHPLDEQMALPGVFYARFMDDWVVLAPTRWKLSAAIRQVNAVLAALKLKQHPRKTSIGRISSGFDFLGYTFSPEGVGVAARSVGQLAAHVTRLYEQDADLRRIGDYVQRWCQSLLGGLRPSGMQADGPSPA
jgi:RNA-directed DNA polymerase